MSRYFLWGKLLIQSKIISKIDIGNEEALYKAIVVVLKDTLTPLVGESWVCNSPVERSDVAHIAQNMNARCSEIAIIHLE